MLQYFDEQLLDDFANTLYGYGDYHGSYWFIGLEEGGGNSYQNINSRLTAWDHRGRRELEQLHTFHRDIGLEHYFRLPPKYQPTWHKLIHVLLTASRPEWDLETAQFQKEAVQDYQVNKLGRVPGENCLIELLPLPSPSTKYWIYADRTEKLPQFRNREKYQQHYLPQRIDHIRERINQYHPAVIVFYGVEYQKYWEMIADAQFLRDQTYNLSTVEKDTTLFVVIAHPAHKYDYTYFHSVGRLIASKRRK
jgi:hypothetical protein